MTVSRSSRTSSGMVNGDQADLQASVAVAVRGCGDGQVHAGEQRIAVQRCHDLQRITSPESRPAACFASW